MDYACVKINLANSKHEELHVIHIPDYREPGSYTQGISVGSFASYSVKRRNRSKTHLYLIRTWEDFEFEQNMLQNSQTFKELNLVPNDDRDLPRFDHNSVWDFYVAIGYDYKKQKWIK